MKLMLRIVSDPAGSHLAFQKIQVIAAERKGYYFQHDFFVCLFVCSSLVNGKHEDRKPKLFRKKHHYAHSTHLFFGQQWTVSK